MTQLPPPQQPPQQPGVVRYGTGVPTPPPPPPKKSTPIWVWILLGFVGVCCVIPVIFAMVKAIVDPDTNTASNQASDRPAAVVQTTPPAPVVTTEAASPPPPPPPAGPVTEFGPGTYEVGVDIKAGTYTCTAGSMGGYWERAKNASGEFTAIIANGVIEDNAKAIVTVKAKEFFKIQMANCVIR